MNAPKVVAEIGCNQQGEMEIAREMVSVAATFGKVDVVKFQKRVPGSPFSGYGVYGAPSRSLQRAIAESTAALTAAPPS